MKWDRLKNTEFFNIEEKLYDLISDYVYVDFKDAKKQYPKIDEDFRKVTNSLISWIEKAKQVSYEKIDEEEQE